MNNKTDTKYNLIIFDFDGTLVDSVPSIHKTANIMAKRYKIKPISVAEVKNAVGAGLGIFLEKIFKKVIDKYGVERIRKDYVNLYKKNFRYKIKTFAGVVITLKTLKEKGIKMLILSNKLFYFIKKSCKYLGIDIYFDEIIGRGDLKKDKPDPYPINYILKKYKIYKKNVLLVGDSQYDAECAFRAGIDFFYLKYGYGDRKKTKRLKPKYIKGKITSLLDVVKI